MIVKLRALGQCMFEVGETRIGPEAELLFGTLLYLVLERGKRVPRAALVELLWPSVDADRGRHSLRQVLYKLRHCGVTLRQDASFVELPTDLADADFLPFIDPHSAQHHVQELSP